ncbi:MAG: hypothetical protein KIS92_05355 [Planctomycetota bacterium]|nr:hypothetical protein [Planctomycetota bacterium]
MTAFRTARVPVWPLRLALCLSLLIAGAGMAGARGNEAERLEAFRHGQELFAKAQKPEEFMQAATVFESILNGGCASGAVCFNLGNAYMRAGRPARALAAYRLAQRALPRDPFVDANLRAALGQLPDAPRLSREAWWTRILFWHEALSQDERLNLMAGGWLLLFGVAVWRMLSFPNPGRGRAVLGRAIPVLVLLGVLLTASAYLGYRDETLTEHGVVIRETTGRKGNGESYAPAFDKPLAEGSEFVVTERRGDWLAVRVGDSGEAWIPSRDVDEY